HLKIQVQSQFSTLLSSLPSLEKLCIGPPISSLTCNKAVQFWRNLVELEVVIPTLGSGLTCVDAETMRLLVVCCPRLKVLKVNDSGVASFGRQLYLPSITHLVNTSSSLKHISLSSWVGVDDPTHILAFLLAARKQLDSLKLHTKCSISYNFTPPSSTSSNSSSLATADAEECCTLQTLYIENQSVQSIMALRDFIRILSPQRNLKKLIVSCKEPEYLSFLIIKTEQIQQQFDVRTMVLIDV
ncbi:hypothetical protein HDV05_002909, partial [Chytridiales sp. JEL 0842]